jgi:hypothetical protein
MELPQDLKDYLDSVPLVTEEQAKQLADHVRALEMEHAAKKRWIAHQYGITDETDSRHNRLSAGTDENEIPMMEPPTNTDMSENDHTTPPPAKEQASERLQAATGSVCPCCGGINGCVRCPSCDGSGRDEYNEDGTPRDDIYQCETCGGTGRIDPQNARAMPPATESDHGK